MSDRGQDDHWDFLAANLGAVPPRKEEAEEQQPESHAMEVETGDVEELTLEPSVDQIDEVSEPDLSDAPPEKPAKRQGTGKGGRVVSGFGHRHGSVDWANLARELGVEAMEQAPEPIPAMETASGPEASASFLPEEPVFVDERASRKDRSSRRSEPAVPPAESGFGAGLIDELVPEEAAPVEAEKGFGGGEESQEERKGRRRRRRRKPRRPEDEQTTEGVSAEETTETVSSEEAESPVQEEPSEEEGGRRRGRRRGGRKRGTREEVSSRASGFGADLIVDHPGQNDSDDFDMLLLEDDEDEDEDEEDEDEDLTGSDRSPEERARQPKRIVHRGIPSWDEAVGHIIDSNMESRSKRPEPSGARQHSGRRRGGDRSGGDRSGNRKRT